jgi:hypothetical protein
MVTEPEYFAGMKQIFRNSAVYVRVKKKGVDPSSLVEYAATIRGSYPDTFDEVWCVTDVDQFDVVVAIRQARNHDVRLAISNPCFEVWLLLHFVECTAPMQGPGDAIRRLKRHVPEYSKNELRFEQFGVGVVDAIARAQALSRAGTEQACNPSSGVWMVAKIIMDGL